MKTPDEIKKGLECMSGVAMPCCSCPFNGSSDCTSEIGCSALDMIEQLERRLAQAERERDAAVRDIGEASYFQCSVCKHGDWPNCKKGLNNVVEDEVCKCELFEWRGVCPENSSDDEHQQA